MAYVSAEQTEEPANNGHQCIPTELPAFKKKDSPLAKLGGDSIFLQDEQAQIAVFGFGEEQAASVLSAAVETCRQAHEGHILRQQIKIERCSIVEYCYRHTGKTHTIFVNPSHNLVEDIAGPIQAVIENMDVLAQKAFDEKRYEDAYRLNLRSLCMDEATNEEKQLRDQILKRLTSAYRNTALLAWLLATSAWLTVGATTLNLQFSFGVLLGLIPLLAGARLFARDCALRFGGRGSRVVAALLIGVCAFLSGATINAESLKWDNHNHWADWFPIAIAIFVLAAIAISRSAERSRRNEIEKHTKEFANTQALEAYVSGLNPSAGYEFRVVFALCVVGICLAGAASGLIAYHMNKL